MTWAWVWWLAAPGAVTGLVAMLAWLAGRDTRARPMNTGESMRSHRAYLDALGVAARAARGRPASRPEQGHTRPR